MVTPTLAHGVRSAGYSAFVADIHLIMFTVDDSAVTASAADVRAWADALGVPGGPLTRISLAGAFEKACLTARVKYSDADGQEFLVTGREVARKDEFVTFEVARDDGRKLAQLKFFCARRGRKGIVAGTHLLKQMVRHHLDPADADAARAWLTEAEALFRVEQGYVPWYTIRRLARAAILLGAVPLARRNSTFFAYEDDLDQVRGAGAFLLRAVENAEFHILPLEDGADLSLLATSADRYLVEQAAWLLQRIRNWTGSTSPNRPILSKALETWTPEYEELVRQLTRHERRLSLRLPQTSSTLLDTNQLISSLVSSAHLPSVIG